jgi:hypothetical protein
MYVAPNHDDPSIHIILDTGASHGLTMDEHDFREITFGNFGAMTTAASTSQFPIIGQGIVEYLALRENGDLCRWSYPAHLCKQATSRLCSPQTSASYLNWNKQYASFESNQSFASIALTTDNTTRLTVPIHPDTNLPIVKAKQLHRTTPTDKRTRPPSCRCKAHKWCRCSVITVAPLPADDTTTIHTAHSAQQVLNDDNHNLSGPQKQLLLDHQRLGHAGMRRIQSLYHPTGDPTPDFDNPRGSRSKLPCLQPNSRGVLTCEPPRCAACCYGKAKRRPIKSKLNTPHPDAQHIPSPDLPTTPGSLVSIDHYESTVRGRLWHTKGRESPHHRFVGGSIFYDHASKAIFVHHQVSLAASDTLRSKDAFEAQALQCGRTITTYHTDNGIFASAAFEASLHQEQQKHSRSGVGAHHQNGGAERAIQTVTSMARSMMLHCHLHWPDSFCPSLWPMAMEYATWVHNHLPNEDTGLAPLEIFCGTKLDCHQLRCCRVWGCPAYVLDPTLQDGGKVPKWHPRARRGQFLGFSPVHSTTVGMIHNLSTGNISAQFHVMYDEKFHTTHTAGLGTLNPTDMIQILSVENYLPDHDISIDGPLPELVPEWQFPPVVTGLPHNEGENTASRPPTHEPTVPTPVHPLPPLHAPASPLISISPESPPASPDILPITPLTPQQGEQGEQHEASEQGKNEQGQQGESFPTTRDITPRRSNRRHNAPRRFPDPERHTDPSLDTSAWDLTTGHHSYLPNSVGNDINPNNNTHLMAHSANKLDWTAPSEPNTLSDMFDSMYHRQATSTLGWIDDWNPLAFAARSFDADNPSYFDIRYMPAAEQELWWQAMDTEIEELEKRGTFHPVSRLSAGSHEIVETMWTLRRKRLPDGTISRYKARLVVRGDQQKTTYDRNTTYAPVVEWSTVRLLLVLSMQHGLATCSIDFKNAFVQSELPSPIFVEFPRGYGKHSKDKVLQVEKSLYGDSRAPRLWYNFLTARLIKLGFTTDSNDACMFCKSDCIFVNYVDDAILIAKDQKTIDKVLAGLRAERLDYDHLGDLASYLGVKIEKHIDGSLELKQPHLTKTIIQAIGLEDSNSKTTPATTTLGKHLDSPPFDESFNYRSVIGMLLYLGNNSRPDCSFAIHQCARFSANPREPHGEAVKRIGRYLRGSADRGVILKPSTNLNLDLYPDADFAGIWGIEKPDDPSCVRSRTGFIITLGSAPITWASRMQTEIALSTMEAEYIACSTAMRVLIPLRHRLIDVCKWLELRAPSAAIVSTVWEDNNAALLLATSDPPQMTLRSKHIAIKYHWFRSQLQKGVIQMRHINSSDQLADILTKALTKDKFTAARQLVMGW